MMTAPDMIARFARFPDELEQTAAQLEERACALMAEVAKTGALGADVRGLVDEAQARLKRLRNFD
jgi:ABC-type transporter Mla subunit MlaD